MVRQTLPTISVTGSIQSSLSERTLLMWVPSDRWTPAHSIQSVMLRDQLKLNWNHLKLMVPQERQKNNLECRYDLPWCKRLSHLLHIYKLNQYGRYFPPTPNWYWSTWAWHQDSQHICCCQGWAPRRVRPPRAFQPHPWGHDISYGCQVEYTSLSINHSKYGKFHKHMSKDSQN